MSIENKLFPNHNKLSIKDEAATAVLVDAELDSINCEFNNDDCVQLDTDGFGYITLSKENLHSLLRLIDEAKEHYNS